MNLKPKISDCKPALPSTPPSPGGEGMRVRADYPHLAKAGMRADFSNSSESADLTFSNELNLESDGWCQLFPLGDFPGKAVIANADGTVTTFDAIQRLDAKAADRMVGNFYSLGNRIKRFIKGVAIFNGHPDMPDAGSKYPDKGEKGLIVELQARDNGLYCKPALNNAGEELLKGSRKLFFSGRWSSDELGEENGKRVFRPDALKSVGLTPRPNLPVEQLNEKEPTETPAPSMKKLIARLAALGISVANDATEDQVDAALGQLAGQLQTANTEKATLANEKAALAAKVTGLESSVTQHATRNTELATQFANERKARIESLIAAALQDGRITAAESPQWQARMGVDASFANEAEALVKLPKKMKTEAVTLQMGDRKVEIANSVDRREALHKLVTSEISTNGGDYDRAYATVQKSHPALFAAMKAPAAITQPKY